MLGGFRMKTLAGLGALAAMSGVISLSSVHPAVGAATRRCPVTVRGSKAKPPIAFVRTGLPVPWVHTWLASPAIWIRLPRRGVLPAQRDRNGRTISTKFPWWRVLGGQLHASAHPVGRLHPRLTADVATPGEYGPTGFAPSTLRFSKPGCWRVTGSLRGHTISFVTRVVIASQ